MFLVRHVDLIGFQLTLELNRRRAISAIHIVWRGRGRVAIRRGRGRTGLQIGQSLVPHFFRLRNLIFQFTNVGMTIGVVRAEIGELRSEFFELLIQSGYSYWRAVSGLGRSLQSTGLFQHRLQVGILLPVGVEAVLFALQLGLESGQDLDIACSIGTATLPRC